MPLNFPSNPSLNDTYTVGDKKWVYDGKGWKLFSAASELVPGIYNHANGAFDKANSANVLAQAAYNQANSISLTGYATETFVVNSIANLVNSAPTTLDTLNELASALGNDANFSTTVTNLIGSAYNQANASNVLAQSSYTHANGSFDKANSANVLAQQAYNQANTGTGIASNAYAHANGAFDRANSANVLAQSAFNQANTANAVAQAAYNQANTANLLSVSSSIIPSANITYDLGTPTRRWRDIYLSGNTIDLAGVQISACNGGLTLPSVVAIGNTTIDGTSGGLILPASTSIGGSVVATPRVSSIDYPGDDTAADPAGGQVIGIVGSGFQSGASVILDGQTISVVTYVNSQRLEITTPAKATGSYIMYIVNPDGGTGIFVPGIQYSGVPTWQSPAAGSLGSVYETNNVSATFSANSDSTVTYSLFSGTLPPGSTLNSSTGVLSGTAALTDNATTYNFTIRATDGENQDTDRAFSLTINPDIITWVSPANGASYQAIANSAISSVSLSATSAAGDSIVYTANGLPTGLSISGSTITGTPTTEQTLSSLITARGNTTNSTATIVLNWSVVVRDLFFRETTLLLNANTNTWITDESPNGFEITPFGDARPSAFSPFNTNWSNFFDGNGDNLQIAHNSALTPTGDFCIEFWAYPTSTAGTQEWYSKAAGIQIYITSGNWGIALSSLNNTTYYASDNSRVALANVWQHLALTRSGNVYRWFVNGQQVYTITSSSSPNTGTDALRIGDISVGTSYPAVGYISNVRYVNGSPVYTSAFTPPTSPLTAIANTVLLTCQSNRFIDNSTNNFAITRNGDVRVTSFGPFTETDTTTGSGYFVGTNPTELSIPNNPSLNLAGVPWTVECWIYLTDDYSDYNAIFAKRVSNGTTTSYEGFVDITSGNLSYYNGTIYESTGVVPRFTWSHCAWSHDGTNLRMFLNGIQVFSQAIAVTEYNYPLFIGGLDGYTTENFGGNISNFRLVKGTALYTSNFTPSNSPLTPVANTQLLTLQTRTAHNNNTFLDESGNKFNITRSGNATQGSFSPFSPSGWSAYFGSGNYLNVGSINSADFTYTGDFTFEFWIYFNTIAQDHSPILALKGSPEEGYSFYWRQSDSVWRLYSSSLASVFDFSYTPTVGVWTHVALSRSGSSIRCFVNGSQIGSTLPCSGTISPAASVNPLQIGGGQYAGTSINGNLSNLRIIKGTALYTSNFTPSTTPLTAIANTVLLTCRSNRFEDEGPKRFGITSTGSPRITPFSPFGPHTITPKTYSGYFDGVGDYLSVPDNNALDITTENLTVECWFYLTDTFIGGTSSGNEMMTLVDKGGISGSVNPNYSLTFVNSSGALKLRGGFFDGLTTRLGLTGSTTIQLNTWYHVALVRSNTTGYLFLNGVQEATGTLTGNMSANGNPLAIGYVVNAVSRFYFPGYISNVRIIKGTAVYTSNFTPSTTPLTVGSGVELLTCQSESFVDNSNNRFTITANGNATPSKYNPFGETVATNVQYSPTVHGGSVYLDGTGDYLTIPYSSSLKFGLNDFTMECWVYLVNPYLAGTSDLTYWPQIMSLTDGTQDGTNFGRIGIFHTATTGQSTTANVADTIAVIFPNNSDVSIRMHDDTPRLKQWTHIALTRQSNVFRLFINGVLKNSTTQTATLGVDNNTTSIGRSIHTFLWAYVSGARWINGQALYTSNFVPSRTPIQTANTVAQLNFTAAGISDATSKNVLETVGDVEVITESPYSLNQSVYFDGNGDLLGLSTQSILNVGTGNFTIEFFVNFPSVSKTYSRAHIFAATESTISSGISISLNGANQGSGGIAINITGTQIINYTTAITPNIWNHIALVREGVGSNQTKLYINGINVASGTSFGSLGVPTFNIGSLQATDPTYNDFYTGYISNLRIVKGTALYTSNFTPSTTPLTAVAGTSLLTCHTNRFIDSSTNNFTITRNGDAKITSRGPFTETRPPRSLKFDGNGDELLVSEELGRLGAGNFTVECWWKVDVSSGDYQTIIEKGIVSGTPANGSWSFGVRTNTTVGAWFAYYNGGFVDVTGTGNANDGSWHHLAVSRDGTSLRLFSDGILLTTHTLPSNFSFGTGNTLQTRIGYNQRNARYINGLIEDLRITKYARYTSNFTPPTTTFLTF